MNQYAPPPQFSSQQSAGDDFDDWDNVEESPEHSLIPKGDYQTALEKVNQETIKDNKFGNLGKPRYNCHFTITDERQHGRKIFRDFMPHSDKSRSAVKSLALATNTPLQGNMLAVLIAVMDKNFIANVGISKGTGEYSDQNTIWTFKPLPVAEYQQAPTQVYQAPPQPAQQPPAEIFTGADGVSQWVKDSTAPSGFRQVG